MIRKRRKMICGVVWLTFGLLFAGMFWGIGYYHYRKWKIMRDTPTRMIVDVTPGRVEVNGRIQPVPGRVEYSPLTNTPCVHYEVVVQEYRSSGKSHYWADIHKVKRGGVFLVADESGKVLIDPKGVKLGSVTTMRTEQGTFREMNSVAQNFIQRLGIRERGFFGVLKRPLRVVETVIPLNQHLYVLGEAVDDNNYRGFQGDPLISPYTIRKNKGLMILSFKSEKELSTSKKAIWLTMYILAGASAFGGMVGMFFLIFN